MATLPVLVVVAVGAAIFLSIGRGPRRPGGPDVVLRVALVLLAVSIAFTVAMAFFETPQTVP